MNTNTESLNRSILRLALPAIAANITTPVLSLVDVALSGHIGPTVYIGAIAVGGTMFNMLYWMFGFLRMGTSGLTAQAYGAGDWAECAASLWRSLIIAFVAGAAMIALSHPLADVTLRLIDADTATSEAARTYFDICIWGAPGILATYALNGWFLGMQSSRPIMWIAIFVNILNIALSVVCVYMFGLGLRGIAFGTAIAQWCSAALGLWMAFRRLPGMRLHFGMWLTHNLGRLFRINTDIFLRTLCLIFVSMWFTREGARRGADILAANAMLMQLFMLFSFFMDGFAFAGEALAGRYYGARDTVALKRVIRRLMQWGIAMAALAMIIYFIAGDVILALLTDNTDALRTASDYRLWAVVIPLAGFMAFVWDGIFIGMTQTRLMLISMAIAMSVFYCTYFALASQLGNHALWLAFILYLFTRGVAQTWLMRGHMRPHR